MSYRNSLSNRLLISEEDLEPEEVELEEYDVEEILDKKWFPSLQQYRYKIKWVGYEEVTWEPAEHIHEQLIEEFEYRWSKQAKKSNYLLRLFIP